tara:strand:- start:54 stop:668 length:615 start_codon:yes stop_codon:yes gene_type:complete
MAFITNLTTALSAGGPTTGVYNAAGNPDGVDNRHGNVRDGGTISDSTNWSSSALGEGNPIISIVSGAGPVEGCIAGGVFNSGVQVINAIQTTIAGKSNTTLLGGQSDSANLPTNPMQANIIRTYFYKTAVIAGNWNVFTGAFSSVTNTPSGAYNITTGADNADGMTAAATDAAANPTQDAPGKLTYRDGSPNPTNDSYKARNNW